MAAEHISKSETVDSKPFGRLQEYLVQGRVCVTLLKELLVEVKELVVVVALILFFVWGVIELFKRLHG